MPSVLVYETGRMEKLMHRSNQPIAETALVHEKQLTLASHTYLAWTCGSGSDDHVVDGVAVGRDEGDAGGPRRDVAHCLPHLRLVFTGDADS